MEKPAHNFYWLLAVVLSVNLVLWLDSFDRYLNSRYHFYLSLYLPDSAFIPSRVVQQALNLDDNAEETASSDQNMVGQAMTPVPEQPSAAALELASGEQVQSASAGVFASDVASASNAASALAVALASEVVASSAVASASAVAITLASASQDQPASAANGQQELQKEATPEAQPKILFAGDSMMQGVAPFVISRMHKEFPKGVFVDLSRQSTGLTVNRYFDWPARIRDESIKQDLRTVVIFLGPNDPWDIYEGRKRYAFPSDKWEKKYRSRVDEVLDFAVSRGMRVIWIGLPVMREERIKLGAKIENRIFYEETKKYKFDYLPTGDLLGGVDDPYKKYIEDPKKGKLVVRADDGIHFTSLGLRMISLRVEELIRKQEKS